MLTEVLTRIRHGPLSDQEWLWAPLRRGFRVLHETLPAWSVRKQVDDAGAFRLDGRFTFSDFASFGSDKNRMFRRCLETCEDAQCAIDLGAHVGLFTLPMSQAVGDEGQVVAVEPSDPNRRFLERHLHLNGVGNVEVRDVVVGRDDRSDVPFHEHPGDSWLNSVVDRERDDMDQARKQQTTLDTLCDQLERPPDVIKIDVEGAELAVLEGGAWTLRRHQPDVFLSVHPHLLRRIGSSVDDIRDRVRELGYVSCDPDGDPVSTLGRKEYWLRPDR